jgi:hypothetical protein
MPGTHPFPHPQGPPSFQRWARARSTNQHSYDLETKKCIGGSLLGLRVLMHNRRTDGRVVGMNLHSQALLADPLFEENMFPEQRSKLMRTKLISWVCSRSGQCMYADLPFRHEILVVELWVDYNNTSRFAILETNGHTVPEGDYGPDRKGEYQPAPDPTGAP